MTSQAPRRGSCFDCGEAVPVQARICPFCRAGLLVDILLTSIPEDRKARYELAKVIAAMGPPFPPVAGILKLMGTPGIPMAGGVTREEGEALQASLENLSCPSVLVRRKERPVQSFFSELAEEHGRHPWLLPAIITACLLLVAGAFLARRKSVGQPEPAVAATSPVVVKMQQMGSGELADLAASVLDSVVSLRTSNSAGAGFFVEPSLVLTNFHVIGSSGSSLEVTVRDREKVHGKVVRSDEWLDIALVDVSPAKGTPLRLGDALAVRTGDRVFAFGSPYGLSFSLAPATVSNTERGVLGAVYLQIDGNINPGNSGGPLVDTKGRAVGIVSLKLLGAEGIALALPVNYLYEADSPWLKPPSPAPSVEKWMALRSRVEDEDRSAAFDARVSTEAPALAGIALRPDGTGLAMVLRQSQSPPPSEEFRFHMDKGDGTFCSVKGAASAWSQVASGSEMLEDLRNTRAAMWLEKHGLAKSVYASRVPVDFRSCAGPDVARKSLIILEGGAEGADRINASAD